MKNTIIPILGLFVSSCLIATNPSQKVPDWSLVEEAMEQQLPRTAIEHIEKILPDALARQAWAEATRALVMKIRLEASLDDSQDHTQESAIRRLHAEIGNAPEPMVPVLETINALWHWGYFKNNRWTFLNRTRTEGEPGEDFATWDLARILAEIDQRFSSALEHKEILKSTPVSEWIAILELGNVPLRYRPTLYDLVVNEALAFYQAGEQGVTVSGSAFKIGADDPVFETAKEFLAWKPDSEDSRSPTLKAIRLYQDLLAFHAADSDPSAFLDADLNRIGFAKNATTGDWSKKGHQNALRQFISGSENHELSGLARFLLAQQLRSEDPVTAHAIAKAGQDSFPESAGGIACYNLIQEIEATELRIFHSLIWNSSSSPLELQYRNLDKLHFRLIELSSAEFMVLQSMGQ
jgi:hypothetical protein